jgi:hypothetical protein
VTTIAESAGQITLLVVAIVGVVAIATWLLNRRRRDVWRALARRHRLTFVEPPEGPRITGRIGGRSVEVVIQDAGSDRDVGGVEVIRMSLSLHGVPIPMCAEGISGLIGDVTALAEERIEFEEEDFNRNVLIEADDEHRVRAYWTRPRQQAFLELMETAPCDQIAIRDGALSAELREIVSHRGQLEQLIDQLMTTASILDGESRGRDA